MRSKICFPTIKIVDNPDVSMENCLSPRDERKIGFCSCGVVCLLVVVVRVRHSAGKVSAPWVFSLEVETIVLALAPEAYGWWVSAKRSSNITEEKERQISLRKKREECGQTEKLSARAYLTRECVVKQFRTSFIEDLDNAIPAKAEFSHAIAMMDRFEGWEEVDEQGI